MKQTTEDVTGYHSTKNGSAYSRENSGKYFISLKMPLVFRNNMFHPRTLARFYELIPLVSAVSAACAASVGYGAFSLYQKPDVWVLDKKSKIPPWEKVDKEGPSNFKEYILRKYHVTNADVEKLRDEIGSYKVN